MSGGKRRALVSVYDKKGLVEFCSVLSRDLDFSLVSTGGTFAALASAGLSVSQVADVTSFPEILGGRVKTLHPAIHGGILAKRTPEHLAELSSHHIEAIDLVICNLYPFVETIKREGVTEDDAVEQIDIGGVTLLRAAAKNFSSVIVICDPSDYAGVVEQLKEGGVSEKKRRELALKAFRHTSSYDAAISSYFANLCGEGELPAELHLSATRVEALRYGENPHQKAALYRWSGVESPFRQLLGKELSYNNLLDIEAAWGVAQEFSDPCVSIVKHCSPCGIATAENLIEAYSHALASDPVSAFGGIIAVNREVDLAFVETIGKLFLEVLIAPSFSEEALKWLSEKKKNCRVMVSHQPSHPLVIRSVYGGLLVQTPDSTGVDFSKWKVVSKKQPTEAQKKSLAFAWLATKHVKSNAIVFVQNTATVGIGAGQPNRVESVWLAAKRAGDKASGAVLGSDAFFPFPDGVQEAGKAGIVAVIQPGGSVRDEEVIQAVDAMDMVMIFTGERHFRH